MILAADPTELDRQSVDYEARSIDCASGNCPCDACRAERDARGDTEPKFTGDDLHPSLEDDVLDELAQLHRDFPLRAGINEIAIVDKMPGGCQNHDQWFGDADPNGTLYLNSRTFGASGEGKKALERQLFEGNNASYQGGRRRFHDSMTSVRSVIAHEYGHFVAHEMMADRQLGLSLEKLQWAAWIESRRSRRSGRFQTRYALVNEDEWSAEAFAVLRYGDDKAKMAPGVEDFARLLQEYFRGRR